MVRRSEVTEVRTDTLNETGYPILTFNTYSEDSFWNLHEHTNRGTGKNKTGKWYSCHAWSTCAFGLVSIVSGSVSTLTECPLYDTLVVIRKR